MRTAHKFELITNATRNNGDIQLRVASQGDGPVILCVHGWPELWYSWRHQMDYFAKRGYRVIAMDVRGYGGSSKPHEIIAYTMRELASDVACVARHYSDSPVILFGHDWGAPIVYNTALLHSDLIRAVVGLSVPFMPQGDGSMLDLMRQLYAGQFFYQLYFQEEGVVEAEVEADLNDALQKIYFSLSGNAPLDHFIRTRPPTQSLLEGTIVPTPFPQWMLPADLAVYVDAFTAGGFRGPINRYRAQVHDPEQLSNIRGHTITQPACFIGGARDAVRHFIPGGDLYANPGAALEDFRGSSIIEGVGHWVQQEAPEQTNQALDVFLEGL